MTMPDSQRFLHLTNNVEDIVVFRASDQFQYVFLQYRNAQVTFVEKQLFRINSFQHYKRLFLIHT